MLSVSIGEVVLDIKTLQFRSIPHLARLLQPELILYNASIIPVNQRVKSLSFLGRIATLFFFKKTSTIRVFVFIRMREWERERERDHSFRSCDARHIARSYDSRLSRVYTTTRFLCFYLLHHIQHPSCEGSLFFLFFSFNLIRELGAATWFLME